MLHGKKAVIFDLDGSLADSMWLWKQIDIDYLGRFGISLPEDLQSSIEGMSFTECAVYFKERFSLPFSIEEIMEDWKQMVWQMYHDDVTLKPGALAFLKKCQQLGIKLGIATSNNRELVEMFLEQQNVKSYFQCIMTACDVSKGKPAPDVYLKVAKVLDVATSECLVFEDLVLGIKAGRSAGMQVCAVEDAYSAYQRQEKMDLADYYIDDFTELG